MEPIKVLSLISERYQDKKDYSNINLDDIRRDTKDELLLIIIKHILFFNEKKLQCKSIKEEKKKHEWINVFIDIFISSFIDTSELPLSYGMVIKYFCCFYEDVKKDYPDFIKDIEKLKSKINFDLFGVAICFLSFLNKNNNLLKILSELEKEPLIKELEIDNDKLTKNYLYYTITDYCILQNIPIIQDNEYDATGISKEKIIDEVKELKCYAELCPINKSFENFLLSLCSCLKDSQDIRMNKEKNVVEFIDLIFIMLNIHLRKPNYWEDSYLSIINNDIYKSSFQYCTDNFNENYIDFVISYITRYGISSEDFSYIFLKGLCKDEFNKTFKNLQLNEDIGSINNKEDIKKLLEKIYKKKKNKKNKNGSNSLNKDTQKNKIDVSSNEKVSGTSIEFNKKQQKEPHSSELIAEDNKEKVSREDKKVDDENIIKEQNTYIMEDKSQGKKPFSDKTNIHDEREDIMEQINSKTSTNKIFIHGENKENFKEKNETKDNKKSNEDIEDIKFKKIYEDFFNMKKEMENKIQTLKEENDNKFNNMSEKIDYLQKEIIKKDIEIKQLKDELKFVNRDLESISFRDLSKRVLNNMINFVNKKNGKLLAGISKRKEKINKINQCFKFDGIEFMKKPFQEICNRFYNSNSRGHIPDIAKDVKKLPIGINNDPAGTILKKYYEVMIDSKDKKVLDFLLNQLKIKGEINDLYL